MASDDDDLQRAIQLSLQETTAGGQRRGRRNAIDLTEEDDDDVWDGFDNVEEMDYWKAILLSTGQGTQTPMFYG